MGRGLRGGELLLLEGDLGLGKTVLAKGIAEGLGIAPDNVTSPSFTLVQEYHGGRVPVFHVDLYRLESVEEMGTLGIEEILGRRRRDPGGVGARSSRPISGATPSPCGCATWAKGSRQIEIVPPGGRASEGPERRLTVSGAQSSR